MALSEVRPIYGIHNVTFYKRTDRLPYGTLKVVGGSSLGLSGEIIKLEGGSFNYAWAVEDGRQTAELAIKTREYPPFLFEVLLGKAPTESTTEVATGTVTTLENVEGTSVFEATTGIASVSLKAGETAELKFSKYIIECISATTVNVRAYTDADFSRGTDIEYENDDLEILASDLTISTGAAVEVTDTGVELTGGSGVIGMTIGDTAEYEVLPPTERHYVVKVGNPTDRSPEFGAYLEAEVQSNGALVAIDCFRCKASGMPISMEEKTFSESEIKAEVFYDSTENGIFELRYVNPSSAA